MQGSKRLSYEATTFEALAPDTSFEGLGAVLEGLGATLELEGVEGVEGVGATLPLLFRPSPSSLFRASPPLCRPFFAYLTPFLGGKKLKKTKVAGESVCWLGSVCASILPSSQLLPAHSWRLVGAQV